MDVLQQILLGETSKIRPKRIAQALRNDKLSSLLKGDAQTKETLIARYRTSPDVRQYLIRVYEEIANPHHPRKTFAPGTFLGFQGQLNMALLTRYVLEEKLRWGIGEVMQSLSYRLLYKHHLRCSKKCFHHISDLVMMAYPEKKLKPYYFNRVRGIWREEKGRLKRDLVRESLREFISILTDPNGKYRYKIKSLPRWVSYRLFQRKVLPYGRNLSYLLNHAFKNSPIEAILFAYPELKLKPYHFASVPNRYWSGEKGREHALEAINELVQVLTNPEGQFNFTLEELFQKVKYTTYHKRHILPHGANLSGMLHVLFKNSPTAPLKFLLEQQRLKQASQVLVKRTQ